MSMSNTEKTVKDIRRRISNQSATRAYQGGGKIGGYIKGGIGSSRLISATCVKISVDCITSYLER